MIFLKVFLAGILLILIGGFAYFAVTDIPVQQTEKIENLSAEEFQAKQ